MRVRGGSWFQLAWWVKLSPVLLEAKWLQDICRAPASMRAGLCLPPKHCTAHMKMPQMGLGKGHATDFNEISDLERRLGAKLQLLRNSVYVILCFLPPAFQSNILQDWDQIFHLWQCFWLIFFVCLGEMRLSGLCFLISCIQLFNWPNSVFLQNLKTYLIFQFSSVFTSVMLVTSVSRKGMCKKQGDLRSCQTLGIGNFKYSCAQGPKNSKGKKNKKGKEQFLRA